MSHSTCEIPPMRNASSAAGCGKITFLLPDAKNGVGVTYSNLAGVTGSHYINIATTWPSTGYRFWDPNVTRTPVYDDRWYRVEWYARWDTRPGANDGMIRWWVNGALNGDYDNVPFPAIRGFIEFQHAPTRQAPPPSSTAARAAGWRRSRSFSPTAPCCTSRAAGAVKRSR